ncbi:MAG: hypothetical protein FWG66_10055 [Spirochaetes bacterium]|nr:hypothetical protein [Spirochaetota bacterium]
MNRTITIEIMDAAALRVLQDLAAINLIRFSQRAKFDEEHIQELISEICQEVDTSLDPCIMAAQTEVLGKEAW